MGSKQKQATTPWRETYGGAQVELHALLILALLEKSDQLPAPGVLPSEREPTGGGPGCAPEPA